MENALREYLSVCHQRTQLQVLILVLMENALRVQKIKVIIYL